jgi:two-component system nitrate/nitrite response regulator NarL
MLDGQDTKQIAHTLSIGHSTARTHAQNVLAKLGTHTRLEATTLAVRVGLTRLLEDLRVGDPAPS